MVYAVGAQKADLHTIMIKFDMKPTQQIRGKIRVVKGALYIICNLRNEWISKKNSKPWKNGAERRSKITHKY